MQDVAVPRLAMNNAEQSKRGPPNRDGVEPQPALG